MDGNEVWTIPEDFDVFLEVMQVAANEDNLLSDFTIEEISPYFEKFRGVDSISTLEIHETITKMKEGVLEKALFACASEGICEMTCDADGNFEFLTKEV